MPVRTTGPGHIESTPVPGRRGAPGRRHISFPVFLLSSSLLMDDVEEQILSYPQLPDAEKEAVEAYVEDHPEWAPLLRDVRALEAAAREASVDPAAVDDPLLAAYVVARHLGTGAESPALAEAFEALERRMEEDPSLRERAEAARRRLRSAEAAVDPVSQFEALTGRRLPAEAAPAAADPPTDRDPTADRDPAAPTTSVVDRLLSLPLAVRGVGAVAVLLLGTYAALFVASTASQSTLDRLAAVDVGDQMVESYYSTNTRSATAPTADTAQAGTLYLDALATLRDARTSTLGLFPRYDAEAVGRAEAQLKRVLDRTEQDSFLALEAQFYLGKANLAQGQVDAARTRFETVVEGEGRLAEEARRILDTLREEAPAGAPGT
jgi:tetratricopeptide (TPR) repeat protein